MKQLVLCLILASLFVYAIGDERGREQIVRKRQNVNTDSQRPIRRVSNNNPNLAAENSKNPTLQNGQRRQNNNRGGQGAAENGRTNGRQISADSLAASSFQSTSLQNVRRTPQNKPEIKRNQNPTIRRTVTSTTQSPGNPEVTFESRRMKKRGRGLSQAMLSVGLEPNRGAFVTTTTAKIQATTRIPTTTRIPGATGSPVVARPTSTPAARSTQAKPTGMTQKPRRLLQTSSLKPKEIYDQVTKTKPIQNPTPAKIATEYPASTFTFPPFPGKKSPKVPVTTQKTIVARDIKLVAASTQVKTIVNANRSVKPNSARNPTAVQKTGENRQSETKKNVRATTVNPNLVRVGRNSQSSNLRPVANTVKTNAKSIANFKNIATPQNAASSLIVPNFRKIEAFPTVSSTTAPSVWGFGFNGNGEGSTGTSSFGGQQPLGVWNNFWSWLNPNFKQSNVSPFFRRIETEPGNLSNNPPTDSNTPKWPNENNNPKRPEEDNSSKPPEEDNNPKNPEEDDSAKFPEEDNSPKFPSEDDSSKFPSEDDSPKFPSEGDSPKFPSEDDSPKFPSEDDSPKFPAEDDSPKFPAEDDSPNAPAEDDSPKFPAEDDSANVPAEDDSPKFPSEDDSANVPAEDDSPKFPAEDDSANVPAEDDSPKFPAEDDSANIPSEDDSPKIPAEDDSANIPSEDDSPKFPAEDDSANIPSEDDSPKFPSEDDSANIPSEDDSPKFPAEDDSANIPLEDDSPKFPAEGDSANIPSGDDSPKFPSEDDSANIPSEDDSPKFPEEDDGVKKPGEDPGSSGDIPSDGMPAEMPSEYETIPPGIILSPHEREEGVYPVYPIEWSVPGYPLNQKSYLRTAGKDSDIENVRVAKRCRLGYFYSLHSNSCIGFIGKQVPAEIVERKKRRRTDLTLDRSDTNNIRSSRNTKSNTSTRPRPRRKSTSPNSSNKKTTRN